MEVRKKPNLYFPFKVDIVAVCNLSKKIIRNRKYSAKYLSTCCYLLVEKNIMEAETLTVDQTANNQKLIFVDVLNGIALVISFCLFLVYNGC